MTSLTAAHAGWPLIHKPSYDASDTAVSLPSPLYMLFIHWPWQYTDTIDKVTSITDDYGTYLETNIRRWTAGKTTYWQTGTAVSISSCCSNYKASLVKYLFPSIHADATFCPSLWALLKIFDILPTGSIKSEWSFCKRHVLTGPELQCQRGQLIWVGPFGNNCYAWKHGQFSLKSRHLYKYLALYSHWTKTPSLFM